MRRRVTLALCLELCFAPTVAAQTRASPTDGVEVVCERDCRELRVDGARVPRFTVRILPDALELRVPRPDGVTSVTRLERTAADRWRVARWPDPAHAPAHARLQAPVTAVLLPRPLTLAERRRRAFTLAGVGLFAGAAVFLAMGVAFRVKSEDAADTFNQFCWVSNGEAAGAAACGGLLDDVRAYHAVSTTAFVLSGAAIVGGALLFALRPPVASVARASRPRWWIGAGPTAVGASVGGVF